MFTLGRRLASFAALPFLSLITPFLFLPILARLAGADAWLAIALGQSAGGFFALVVSLGYNTVGPARVARADQSQRLDLLSSSIHARVTLLIPCSIAAIAVAVAVAPSGTRLLAGVMAFGMTLTGLSSSWYMIGLGRALLIALYEIAPRLLATIVAAIILITTGQVIWYPVLLTIASIVSVSSFVVPRVGLTALARFSARDVVAQASANGSALATEVAAGAYNSLSVVLVGAATTPTAAASYVSGDKLYKIGQYAVSAVGNSVQGWVVEDGPAVFLRRVRVSLVVHTVVGVIGLLIFALAGPALSALLFGPEVAIDEATALGLGVATLGIALGTALGRVTLVALGLTRQFMFSVLSAAAVGVPSIVILAGLWGAAGGAWGLAIGETVSVVLQTVFVVLGVRAFVKRGSVFASGQGKPEPEVLPPIQ